MRVRKLGRLLQVLVLLAAIPMGLLGLQGCNCTCGAGSTNAVPNDGRDGAFGSGAKPGGGNNRGGNAKKCKCPKSGSKKKDVEFNKKLWGANGQQYPFSKPVADGTAGRTPWRIDLENPRPGYRPASLHVQLDNVKGGTRYEYAGKGKFRTSKGASLPRKVQEDIDNDEKAQRKIREALESLKEKW
ncbi:hypothetical protein [Microlunatus sp. GCM10028923]|uniref:hypothetical protein n=1 Tax=Microlunatus sp. GCM10028923 TaxID=3273400 RepID=UPI00360B045B